MKQTRTTAAALAAVVLALGAAGCGSDSTTPGAADQAVSAEPPATDSTASTASTPAAPEAVVDTSGKGAVLPISKDLSKKPAIPKPKGKPPAKLVVADIVPGTGKAIKAGDSITVKYVGVSFSTGEQFDASWDNPQGFPPFELGAGNVIAGWDQGLVGMKVGGRRELVIPADLAYGDSPPPGIEAGETLVFVVDLIDA